jgi:hypothetical protein
MALQLRRGAEASRLGITPAQGEPIITEQGLYVGDGITPGGVLISGTGGVTKITAGTNITINPTNGLGNVTVNSTGGGLANIVEDTSPQLGGNLDTNGHTIISGTGIDININPGVGGKVLLNSTIGVDGLGNITKTGQLNFSPTGIFSIGNNTTLVDGNVYITRNSYASGSQDGFTFAQHHNTPDAVNFQFLRTRGTGDVPTALLNGDDIIDIWFLGRHATAQTLTAAMSVTVEGIPTATAVPAKITFATNNGTTTSARAELSATGVWKANSLQNFSGTSLNITGTGTVSATNAIISSGATILAAGTTLTINGAVTGGSLIVGSIISGGTTVFGTTITAVNSATFTSTITTTTMTVSNVAAGTILAGMALSGGSVTAGTYVVAFVSGINGGAGVYTLNQTATGTPTTGTSYTVSTSQLVTSTTILSGGDINILGNTNLLGNARLLGQNSLRFADADSSNYVAFKAPTIVAANVTWTLPAADGTSGQVLSTNGTGTLSWAASGGGSGLLSRTAVSETTASLANGATSNISIAGAKGYVLYKIQTSVAAWVRIYTNTAARSADSSRAEGVDPLPGAGVIAEVITTGAATIIMSPGVFGFNDEALPTSVIALAVTNKSGGTSVVTVTLTILQVEA